MARKRYTPEQIIAMLREVEVRLLEQMVRFDLAVNIR